MPNPLDTLYDQLKGQYPDLVDRSEFIGKLSNEDELKKLHDAASKDIPGFVDFDNFKSKVNESLSSYDADSDYREQNEASTTQQSAPTDITIPRREKAQQEPSGTQNGGVASEAYTPVEPGRPTATPAEPEPFDRETGDLDELDRRYEEKLKRLEDFGRWDGVFVNEESARKHYEGYSKLLDEAEQDRLVYNRRVKAAEDERAEQQRQLDLQSKDRKTRRAAEYGGYTNDQVRKEQERLKKERAYLEDPKSKRKADYSKRVMEYNADQTALSGEADKRNKRYERKRSMYDEVKKVAEDPDVQKRITGNDAVSYVLSGNNTYALQNYDAYLRGAKEKSVEELADTCKTIAGQQYARGYNRDIYAPLTACFMANYYELMYRMGGDEPKSAMEMRYDMIDKVTESSPEGDDFMLTLRNYIDGTAGMGTANFENDQSERANIPQFAVVDEYNRLVAQKEDENMRKVEQIGRYPQQEGVTDLNMAAAATNINYDAMLEKAFEKFGDANLKAYITAYALRNGISIDEAARRVNQSIWDETLGKTMDEYRPKSGFEFFVRRIFSDNMFSKLGQIGLRARNGTLGSNDPFMMSSMALDEYAKDHPVWDTAAVVTNFAVLEGPIFSGYGKLAGSLVGMGERAIIGAATKTAEKTAIESTAKALNQSFWYRLAKGVPTGALVGFQYGTMSGTIDQAFFEGKVDFGKSLANGAHISRDFAIMHAGGEVFGMTGDAILRRGQRLSKVQGKWRNRFETASLHFLNNVAKTTTNASIVTGLYAFVDKPALERENKKIAAENARLPEDQRKPLNQIASVEDTFYSTLKMFAGLDAVGMLRSAWSIGVRGEYERNKHVKIHFDKFDKEALEKAFGKNPNSLLRQIVFGNVDGIPAKWFEIDPEAEQEIYKELGRELTPAEKEAYATYGFTELRKVILNKDIPWATRAKIVSVVTGRIVQEPPVSKGTIEFVMDKSGTVAKRIIVKSLDMEGNVIQIREFGEKEFEAARNLYESLNDMGWRNNALLCGNLVIDAIEDKTYADTVDEMAREKGIPSDQFEKMVFGIKQKDITGEKVTYQERQLVDEFDKRHQEKQKAEIELTGPDKMFEQVAREVFGAEWKQAKDIPFKSWGEMTEAEKEFVNKYIERMGAMGVAERNKLMNANPDWVRTAKEYEESVRRRMEEAERPAESEPLPALEDEKVSVETPVEERVEPVPEVIELEEEKPAEPEPVKEETPAEEPVAEEKPDTEGQPRAGTIGFEPVEQPTERERFDAERKEKAATITDADIEANREALGIPEGTALTDEARQIYAEDLAEDLMRYERFKRGESDEKARFHDYWESKFNPKRPKLERPIDEPQEPEDEEFEEDEVTEADALIEQLDNLKGRSDLERYRNALKVFAGDDEVMSILEDLEPHDITEWVSSFLGLDSGKGYSMLWESKTRGGTVIAKGFKEETGWSWNDVKGFAFMFDNKNGMSPRRVAEKIWEELPSGMKDQYSDVDVFNIMMDLFQSSSRKSDLTNYIRNNRLDQVRDLLNRRRSWELDEIARYKERENRGDEEPIAPPVSQDENQNEFAVREDEVAPFSLLSLSYRDEEVESGTVRSRARTRKQLGTIAKALGYKIRWVADKPYNAKIDTDEKVLYVNIRTDRPLESVIGHEITHDLRKSDPKAYDALKRYAIDLLGKAQWDSEVKDVTDVYNEEYKRRGWEPIREDKAEEEVVCDTMGKVLHSKKGLRELAGSIDTSVAGKVYRLLRDVSDKVKSALGKEHDYSTMDMALNEFFETVEQRAKKGSIATIQNTPAEGEATIDLSLRRKPAPKKVKKVYKLMRLKMGEDGKTLGEDGKLYPLYIDSGTGLDIKNWYDADSPDFEKLRSLDKGYWLYDLATGEAEKADKPSIEQIAEADSKGKRYMIIRDVYDDVYDKYNKDKANWEAHLRGERKWKKKKPFTSLTPEQLEKKAVKAQKDAEKRYNDTRRYYNIGLNGSGEVGEYALRPGWHAGSHPTMRQIGKGKNRNLRDDTFVWVEGYVPDDVEYQTEAEGNIDKDIPTHIPTDGHYLMLTNPNAKAAQADRVGWYVAGAFRPERILSDWEARQVIDEWNAEHPNDKIEYDFERESGRVFNAETMQLEEPGSEGTKQGIHRDPSGGYSVTDKADIESLAPRMEGESEAEYNERIGEIEADEKAFVEGDGQFSLKKEDTMRDNSVKYFEEYHVRGNKDRKYGPLRRGSITRQALDKANDMIAEMRDYIAPWYDREAGGNRYLPEEVYGLSTIFDNASYGATLENTLICTRTLAYNDFCDSVKRKLGRPLTKRESFLASQMLYDIATDPQCLYCYVSLDRKAYDEYLLRYFDERDAVIERYNKMRSKSKKNIDALYTTFLDGRKDTYQMRSRFNSWLQLADHDSAIGRDKVALSSDRKNALAQESDEEAAVRWREISKQYNRLRGEEKKQFKQSKEYLDALHNYLATEQGQIKDACAYAQGASWAKKEAEYRSYTGELLRTTKRMLGGLASHYGLRFYSFSEYSPAFILENMQMVRDAALRGLKGFAYTKEIDFCKIFLPTGININCSVYGRRNAAGEIVMDERQGANWDEARALRDQYENMGIVFVATDDEMVRWAKEQPWIDVIIPFHIVRTGADIAEFYGWTNYTNVSADHDAQGRHKDIMPPEHNNSIEDYDRLIAERGLTRRFPQFYDGPGDQNYMKLINETRRKASDTPILTPVFNMEEAKKSFDKFVEKGGYWGGFYEVGADDVVRAVDEVVADIKAGKSAGEVEYGRQDIDFDTAMQNLEKTRRRINRNREHGNTPKTSFSLKRDDSKELFDYAKERFGTTDDFREAGYILPDGTMLDFSGRHELDPGTDSSFLAGRRATDHRAVNQISFVYDENGDEVDTGVSSNMPDFIKRGAIRIDNNAGAINLFVAPTSEQKKVLRQLIRRNGGDVQVDFGDGFDSDHYVEYDGASAQRVLADIDHYFDEGVKPKGNIRFSLKREDRDEDKVPTFYSNAAKAVENVKQNKATAEQWKAMLTKQGGIKAGEDKWMGLSEWLDEHKGQTLTKEEVAQFVAENGIQMEEVDYQEGVVEPRIPEKVYEDFEDYYNRWTDDDFDTPLDHLEYAWGVYCNISPRWIRDSIVPHLYHDGTWDLRIADRNILREHVGIDSDYSINRTRLEYTTEGLENKREIAFVVPNVEPYQEYDEIHFGPENQGKAIMWVRFGETTDSEGKRVLVIDEVQSNRHQDAREKGYREDFVQSELDQARQESSSYSTYLFNKYIRGKHPGEDFLDYATDEEKERFWELSNKVSDILKNRYHGVPAAPFEKNWHEVAMKRMLRLAAEEGYAKLAWTTGGQQARRYDLGQSVKSIEKTSVKNDKGAVRYNMYDHEGWGRGVFVKDGIVTDSYYDFLKDKPLTEVVGKEIAEKMMSLNDGESIQGDDLMVGGEGMKSFYDKMLPSFMNKYGKRWGVKVGEVTLNTPGRETMHSVDINEDMRRSVVEQGQPLFSLKRDKERTLMGVHNITAEKLRSALKLGGLANPSMAVIDTKVGDFDNFGEISLIPASDLIASRTGRNAGTWGADAYSPRFPETHRRLGKGGDKKMRSWIKGLGMRKEMEFNTEEQFNDYYNGFNIRDNALVYPFLHEKGLSDQVDYYTHMNVDQRLEDDLREANGDQFVLLKRFDEDEEYKKKLTDIVIGDEIGKIRKKEDETFQQFRDRRREWAKEIRETLTEEDGYINRNLAEDLLYAQARAYRENGKFSESRTLDNAEKYIRDNGLQEEYQQYFEQKMQELGAETQVYAGSDSMGRSKFKPIDLESVSKQMKKQGRAGGEGGIFEDSPGAIRAKLLNPMKTLDQIRKEKGRIVSHDEFEQAREEYQDRLRDYADTYANGSIGALADILTSRDMAETAKQYNKDLDAGDLYDLNEFKDYVRALPTEYFETKFERPVGLEEFKKAVVPDNLPLDLYGALERAGLEIVEYPAGDREERQRVTLDAVKGDQDVLFSLMGRRGAARLDDADHGGRMDRNDIAKEMEKEGKDARTIKLATGWERGADNKWRYETPDGDFVGGGINVADAEQARLKLSDIWDSPELFKAYPEFAEIPVEIVNNPLGASATTQVDRSYEMPEYEVYEKFIRDYDQWLEDKERKREDYEARLLSYEPGEEMYELLSDVIKNITREIEDAPNRLARTKEIVADPDKIMYMKLYLNKAHLSKDGVISADAEFSGNNARQVVAHEIQHLIQETEGFASGGTTRDMTYGEYRRLAGETEARNVSRRVDMPEYERRRSLASDTEDVPRERQTVRYTSKTSESNSSEVYTDADGNEVYTETREDGTKDREITTYGDGSKKALWYDDKGNLKERLDYFPNGEVSQVANYDSDGNLTRHIQYDENKRITSYYLPAIGTDWKLDENGIARGKSNGVEIKPYNFQFSLKREKQTHSANFKNWFGDWENDPEHASKVVDENGEPKVVLHGTPNGDFYVFDPEKAGSNTDQGWLGTGFYFYGNAPEYASQYAGKKGRVLQVYLDIKNPYIASVEEFNRLAEANDPEMSRSFREQLEDEGYDGVYYNGDLNEEWVAFRPEQIKSATENNGDFDPNNPDIRFSLKRRRNRDDYTDEDRADAAIIANTYLAQADALRQQIEADREQEHQLVEERNRLLAFEYPAADPADRPAIMDRINDLRSQINDLRNANYENNTKLRSMDYEYRVAKEILNQGAVTDEEASRFDAGQMTREEQVLESLFKAAADSRADKKAKQKAVRGLVRELTAITDNFKAAMKARGIESQRKHYDKGTVDHIIRLARAMMNTGYIDNMTSYEVKRLMGMINNAATRESIEEQAGRIVDMMLDHQIKTLKVDFTKQLKVQGARENSSGVMVQAGLDQEGQVIMKSYRESMKIIKESAGKREIDDELTEWGEFYVKTLNDMGDADPVKAEQARKIFAGILLAERWFNDVRMLEINGRILRSQMEDFKASNKPDKTADKDTKQRYADALADYQEMLRQNKIRIIEAYERMTGEVGATQAESVRRAQEFAEAQKQRVNEIQHNANSDLEGVDDNTQVKTPESRVFGANKNNVIVRLLFESAGTYEKFMRFFGRLAPNGEGYLFKRFMTQYHHARQDYWKGRHSAFEEMDKKMAEVFGKKKMHWSDIYEMTRDYKKFPPITVSYWDGYRDGQPYQRMDELSQSEALYLYMINKMPDGRMKLRHMGITDDVVQQMAGQIDPKLIYLADWLQSEFLPKMRIKYNEVHKRVFGADMAAIEDYFPLRINKLSRRSDTDIANRDNDDNKPSTITGAIVKRRVNTNDIDLHTDAFDVALAHVDEMEHWSAFAEFNRDNNALVNYKRFRTKVSNLSSLEFGAGDVLLKNFTDAVAIAADAYHPKAGKRGGDYYSTRVAKFVSTAKIALRQYTALKQLLSLPAFWANSDPLEQMKATVNVANSWQWAIENLPGFAERWQSRQAGNIKLANYNDLSGLRRRKAMRKLQRAGMWANAAIDGLACAMGGKAVYETKLKRYRKMGYDDDVAKEKALIDAAIAYNNSQQSSEGAYVSTIQVDRTWYANAFSVFRSASMGYTRRLNTSLRQLRNATFKQGYGKQSVEFLKKQMMRDGLTEEQAEKWARKIYRRANLKAAASVAIFGQILPFFWNLGANMFYLLFGDDKKEKESILADSFRHSFFGPVEGLVGGNVISEIGDIAADTAIGKFFGDSVWGDSEAFKALGYRDFTTMPLSSDLQNVLKYFARDEVKAANEVVNILFQVATGVNPQTITDWVTAILDFSRSDMERRDIAMFVMRLLSTPQQQLDKFYLDQLNLSQQQASKMSTEDLIKRYATYKRWRETPLTGWWMYSDERVKEVEQKFQKRYEDMLDKRAAAEEGMREAVNNTDDLSRKRTMMRKLQKELADSIETADPELYKKALEGEKADDDEYVRLATDKDVEQMAELAMKKKALRAAHDRKTQADKDVEAGRITQEEYDAIYKECAHEWKLYNYLDDKAAKHIKELKGMIAKGIKSRTVRGKTIEGKDTPEEVMDSIRTYTDKALQMRPEDMKMKKGDKKHSKKNKKK